MNNGSRVPWIFMEGGTSATQKKEQTTKEMTEKKTTRNLAPKFTTWPGASVLPVWLTWLVDVVVRHEKYGGIAGRSCRRLPDFTCRLCAPSEMPPNQQRWRRQKIQRWLTASVVAVEEELRREIESVRRGHPVMGLIIARAKLKSSLHGGQT